MNPPETSHLSHGGPWLDVATGAAQLARVAALDPATDVWDFLADLTSRSDAPHGLVERLFALRMIERAAWEFIGAQIACGLKTPTAGLLEFTQTLTILESTEWVELTAALKKARLETLQPPLAVRVRQYVDAHACERIRLRDVARALGVSIRRLTRTFHDRTSRQKRARTR